MPARREYGAGSVYQRASDGLWVGTIEAGWTGQRKRRRITVSAKTKQQAQKKLRDRKAQITRDGDAAVSVRATVKSYADETWLAQLERSLAPNAYSANASALRKWIIPTIGHKRFDALTPADVRAVADAQRAAKLAPSTQLRTHSVLTSLLKSAMAEGLPVPQRLLVVKAPSRGTSDRKDMEVPEALAVLRQAALLPHGSRFLFALLEARRQGECLGLTWDQLDFEREAIEVSWQLQALRYRVPRDRASGFRVPDGYEHRQLQGALHLVRPKTKSGRIVIPMVEPVRDALLAWRDDPRRPESPHGLVWPDLDGSPTVYKTDDAEWYGLQDAAKVGHPAGRYYTIHETKHTTVTLLLEAGVPERVIVAIAGHSAWASSQAYAHVNLGPARDALNAVVRRLELSPPPKGEPQPRDAG